MDEILDRKITLPTEGFTTTSSVFCENTLRDRTKLSKENALTIAEYSYEERSRERKGRFTKGCKKN